MEKAITSSNLSDLGQQLYELKALKEAEEKLIQISENVLENDYPFSLELRVKITIPDETSDTDGGKKTAEELLNMLTATDSEDDFMAKLSNIQSTQPKYVKEISVDLSDITDKVFFGIMERVIQDTSKQINSKLKTIKL
jgi:hypothetical protein